MGKQNVILADCCEEEIISFVEGLQRSGETFTVKEHVANWKRTGKLSELKRYAKYFEIGFLYFLKRREYGRIVCWQQFYALIFCFFCEMFRVKKRNAVIALNYTYKEKRGRLASLYRWFMGKCLSVRFLDYIHVPSKAYADTVSEEFGFPRDRIIVTTFGVNDQYEAAANLDAPEGFSKDGYALAIGRSNRDFDFLIRAWEPLDYPLVVISDTYQGSAKSDNITILTNVAGEDSYPWIVNCGLMVIPIDDGSICSGDTVLLNAMALKRKILVTKPSTLAEMYISDGENALLTEKDEYELRRKAWELLNVEKYADIGVRARKSFLDNYSRKSMGEKISSYMRV